MKRDFVLGFLVALGIFMWAAGAAANDSKARVGAGGITLVKSEHIRMLEEVLEISMKTVSVTYRFRNESDRDVTTTVAFPMPPYVWTGGELMWDANQKPVSTFVAFVDGTLVPTKTITRALVGDVDVTEELHRAGLSDMAIQTFAGCHGEVVDEEGTMKTVSDLTPRQKKLVRRLNREGGPCPEWKVASTLVWEQTFPAHREVLVEHRYAPFVGSMYHAPYQKGREYAASDAYPLAEAAAGTDEACLDAATKKTIDGRIKALAEAGEEMVYVTLHDVEYILGTGRNWKGSIGKFTLRIRKESPDQLVSLCFPGKPREVDAEELEFVENDYVPQDKLVVYFYDVVPDVLGSETAR